MFGCVALTVAALQDTYIYFSKKLNMDFFGFYVHILFVYVSTAYGCTQLNKKIAVNLSFFTVHLAET